MTRWTLLGLFALMAAGLGGCAGTPSSGASGGAAVPTTPAQPVLSSVTKLNLDEADRMALADAQIAAFNSGQKQKWQGKRNFGFVDPGVASSGLRGECRNYKQTIFINGRSSEEQGQACKDQGGWKLNN